MGPLAWLSKKVGDHPGMTAGAVLGGALGSVLGPVGTVVGVSMGVSIGNNLDQPAPDAPKVQEHPSAKEYNGGDS